MSVKRKQLSFSIFIAMQADLFGPTSEPVMGHATVAPVQLAPDARQWLGMAAQLPAGLRMGVSTWSYPGWDGLVWDGLYDASVLSRDGLQAYAQHPLMRTVSVDRTFWRPLTATQYAQMAAQVPEDFRFLVKCPNLVTDALLRGDDGLGQSDNPAFLSPTLALQHFVQPVLDGMGDKLGVLLFQLSPLPLRLLHHQDGLWVQLAQLLAAVQRTLQERALTACPIVALEVRDPALLTPALAQVLRSHGATYCLGLHGKMPPIEAQLPLLRALWPGPLVCRWSLNRSFGPFGYRAAQEQHAPFNAIRSPDPHTRTVLARTIAGITGAGQPAFVTISNDAEGCAPRSIGLLAQAVVDVGAPSSSKKASATLE